MIEALHSNPNHLAREVSALIAQADQGRVFDRELTGHAYDVQQALGDVLAEQPDLRRDLESKIDRFARKSGTAHLYLHMVITDQTPDLGDYDPSQVFVYDGMRNGGADFSSADLRVTIYGTVMTSVNVTDLAAYFRAGQKRQLVVHLGTDRDQDLNAFENMLTQLPGLLAAAGMKPEQIAAVIAAVKSGNLPPVALKALHIAAEMARLKSMPGVEAQARLQKLGQDFARLIAQADLKGLPSILMQGIIGLAPVLTALAASPARTVSLSIHAQNDNRAGLKEIRAVIKSVRDLTRDKKTLTPAQRRELAAILRDLRAGIKNAPSRLQTGLARMNQFLARSIHLPVMAAMMATMIPVSLAATARFATPVLMAAFRATLAPLIARPGVLPPVAQQGLRQVMAAPSNRALANVLSQYPVISQTVAPQALVQNILQLPPQVLAVPLSVAVAPVLSIVPNGPEVSLVPSQPGAGVNPVVPPDQAPSVVVEKDKAPASTAPDKDAGPLRNPDGTVMDCCREFEKNAGTGVHAPAPGEPVLDFGKDGSLTIRNDKGEVVETYTAAQIAAQKQADDAITAALDARRARDGTAITPEQQRAMTDDLVAFAQDVKMGKNQKPSQHQHDENCHHGPDDKTQNLNNAEALSASDRDTGGAKPPKAPVKPPAFLKISYKPKL